MPQRAFPTGDGSQQHCRRHSESACYSLFRACTTSDNVSYVRSEAVNSPENTGLGLATARLRMTSARQNARAENVDGRHLIVSLNSLKMALRRAVAPRETASGLRGGRHLPRSSWPSFLTGPLLSCEAGAAGVFGGSLGDSGDGVFDASFAAGSTGFSSTGRGACSFWSSWSM
jgi:hypothetical protein